MRAGAGLWLRAAATAFLLGGSLLLGCSSPPEINVLLISVDTLRADHLGVYGYDRPTSPHIDSLGRSGLVFEQAICQNTNTNPSHASILSGLYPRTHGNWDNFFLMDDATVLAPEILRRAGYRTAAFVSGYTLKAGICALDRGFDTYDEDFGGRERRGDHTTDRALAWLDSHADEPFFLFVHLFDPHGPYDPPADMVPEFRPRAPAQPVPLERIPRYQRLPRGAPDAQIWTDLQRYMARYDQEIAFADAQVGRLLAALDRLEIAGETLVILTSDHGEALDERFHLLDHGGGIGDEEIRVPLIFRFPDGRLAGRRYGAQVQSIDIVPTLAGAIGLDYPAEVQGLDLVPLVQREAPDAHPYAFTETRLIPRRWGNRGYDLKTGDSLKAVRSPDAKLVVFPGKQRNYVELYDLNADPSEQTDVRRHHQTVAATLLERLDGFMRLPARWNRTIQPGENPAADSVFCTLGYLDCD